MKKIFYIIDHDLCKLLPKVRLQKLVMLAKHW
jgi:hypothetical protein